ncbi:hypothetical protein ACL02U_13795 [Streptomyces sp. MS06]|uniref:hypothetical protein n=1 Tax=Streptomyces sp. MS06 TaxID=3385974 RepID=UPI0039A22502
MKSNRTTTLAATVVAAAVFSTGLSGAAMAADRTPSAATDSSALTVAAVRASEDASAEPSSEEQELIDALTVIDAMPAGVAEQGDAVVQAYLAKHLPRKQKIALAGWWQTTKCVAAITMAVASAAVPAAKILKLKAFIKKAGSVKEAAYLLIRVAKGEEKLSELGATLGGLAGSIIGIDSIARHCR